MIFSLGQLPQGVKRCPKLPMQAIDSYELTCLAPDRGPGFVLTRALLVS